MDSAQPLGTRSFGAGVAPREPADFKHAETEQEIDRRVVAGLALELESDLRVLRDHAMAPTPSWGRIMLMHPVLSGAGIGLGAGAVASIPIALDVAADPALLQEALGHPSLLADWSTAWLAWLAASGVMVGGAMTGSAAGAVGAGVRRLADFVRDAIGQGPLEGQPAPDFLP